MTKVYLVIRKYYCDGNLTEVEVNEVFTNSKKAEALKKYFDASDKLDERNYPVLKERYKTETLITTMIINKFDYSNLAKTKEMELELPY